jgi:ribosomal protein S18 acetylase RimI-like enzyme
MTPEFRRLREGEAARLRELRLRALRDTPAAFATSLHDARARPWEHWLEATLVGATAATQVTVVVDDGSRWLGMVTGRVLADPPGSAWLEALWVDPSTRRSGLGSGLIEAVAAWSRDSGAVRLELSVTESNAPARALYADSGFRETGRRRPLPADPSRTEVFLARRL